MPREKRDAASAGAASWSRRPRRRATFLSVVGELLITAGVVALLYVTWQLWVGDAIIGAQKHAEAEALSQEWLDGGRPSTPSSPESSPAPTDPDASDVPVPAAPERAEPFGVMFVPRFGADWRFAVAGGVTRRDVLDEGFVGHYDDTALPGEVGNAAFAAHRWTSGAPFDPIDRLVVGDAIVVQTSDGWYTYRFRTLEYVQETQVDVLAPVPRTELQADGRYLTLTSCAPKLNMLERIIAYALFESFTPTADGPPASLTEEEPA